MSGYFGPGLFAFLNDLAANNDRAWFAANRARYTREVDLPLRQFVADAGIRLGELSPSYTEASPFRIYRDTRFARDKTPFNPRAAAVFSHESKGKEHGVPGFYVHLAPGHRVGGGGMHQPDPATLGRVRDRIVARPGDWEAVIASGARIEGDALKRPPAGYDPDHRFIDDLKRKNFYSMTAFTEEQVCAPEFIETYLDACRSAAPLVRFLTRALDLTW